MKRNPLLVFLAFALLLAGCLPANPAAQSADAPNIETIVAATYAAISAQTQAAEALFTATPENTPTATNTPLPPTVTPTNTPTFVIYTATPISTNTPLFTNTPDRPADYECTFLKTTIPNGTTMGPKNAFDWVVKVNNSGIQEWKSADIDFVYVSGDKFFQARKYNLWKDVPAGKNIELGVDMIAPKEPGTYSTTWALDNQGDLFCEQTLRITVK